MSEVDILKRSAAVINNKRITIEVDIRNQSWLDRKLKKPAIRTFNVIRASLGTLINFSDKALEVSTSDSNDFPSIINSINQNAKFLAECIAILIEDTQDDPDGNLVKFLLTNVDNEDSKAILGILIRHSKVEDFMSSIILIRGMSLLKTEEMIASEQIIGKPSEE